MSIEFTFVTQSAHSKVSAEDFVAASLLAQAAEHGFDAAVIDQPSTGSTALNILAAMPALRPVLNHTVGNDPVAAACAIAALKARLGGRLSLRVLDGTTTQSHAARLQRTDEYLTLLKRLWSNASAFDHEGPFYSVRGGVVPGRCSTGALPVQLGGLSGTALRVAARHADSFELAPGTPRETEVLMQRVRAAAAPYGRSPKLRFALPVDFSSSAAGTVDATAVTLLAFAEAGVSEFLVQGIASLQQMRRFGEVAALVRHSLSRRERAEGASASHGETAVRHERFFPGL